MHYTFSSLVYQLSIIIKDYNLNFSLTDGEADNYDTLDKDKF